MNVAGQLNAALQTRIRLEEAFKQNVIDRINVILRSLRDCPRDGLTPAASSALDLTQRQLDDFIRELTNPTNLTDAEAQRIASTVDRDDLRRIGGPTSALPRVGSVPGPTGPTGSSWWPFGKPAPAPAPAALAPTELKSYDELYPRGSDYRGSIFDDPDDPDALAYLPRRRNAMVGGWKSPRKRKPRGTKKYRSKV